MATRGIFQTPIYL